MSFLDGLFSSWRAGATPPAVVVAMTAAPTSPTPGIGHNGGPMLLPAPSDHPDNFLACVPTILAAEGGFVDDPEDPGGATNRGITMHQLSAWLGRPCTDDDVKALDEKTTREIYRTIYWNGARCDDLPVGLALEVFDLAVNAGVPRAVKVLQCCLGFAPADQDGAIGPKTLAAAQARPTAALISDYADARRKFYRGLSKFPRFGNGWIKRANLIESLALGMRP
jgi:lysozyme family protein